MWPDASPPPALLLLKEMGQVAERPRQEGGQELVEGLLSKSTYRMSIVKLVTFIATKAGLSQGYIFSPTTNLNSLEK